MVSVGSTGGFTSPVTLSASDLPAGVKAAFSRNPVAPGQQSKLTLKATRKATAGTWTISVDGVGGARAHGAPAVLTVS
jgi:hypothetical protein